MDDLRTKLIGMRQEKGPTDDDAQPSELLRTGVSLVIVIHLFCVLVVLSSNFSPSSLQERLVSILALYTKTLHLDPNFVPYHLTEGEGESRLHQWLVRAPDGKTYRFPDREWRGGFPHERMDMLARVAAFYAEAEMDEVPAEFARGIAGFVISQSQADGHHGGQALVRCVQYVGDGTPAERDALDDTGVNVVYEATVWHDSDGRLSVLKRSPEAEVAPPVSSNSAGQEG